MKREEGKGSRWTGLLTRFNDSAFAGGLAPCLPHFRNGLAFLGHIHFVRAQTRSLFYYYTKLFCCTSHLLRIFLFSVPSHHVPSQDLMPPVSS